MSQFFSSWLLDNSKIPKKNTIYNDSFLDYYYKHENEPSFTKTLLESKIVIRKTDIGLHFILQVLLADLCYVYKNIDGYMEQIQRNDNTQRKYLTLKKSRLKIIQQKFTKSIKKTITKSLIRTRKRLVDNKIKIHIQQLLYQTILLIVKLLDVPVASIDKFDSDINQLKMNVNGCVIITELETAFKILISKYILLNESYYDHKDKKDHKDNIDHVYQIIVYIVLSKYLLSCGIIVHIQQENHIINIINNLDLTKLTNNYLLKFVLYIITVTKTTDTIKEYFKTIINNIRNDINNHKLKHMDKTLQNTNTTSNKKYNDEKTEEIYYSHKVKYSIISQIQHCYLLHLICTSQLYVQKNNIYDDYGNLLINKYVQIEKNSTKYVSQLTETTKSTTNPPIGTTLIKPLLPTQFPIKSIDEFEKSYSWHRFIIQNLFHYHLDHRGLSIRDDQCNNPENTTSHLDDEEIEKSKTIEFERLFQYHEFYINTENLSDTKKRYSFIPTLQDRESSIRSLENEVGDDYKKRTSRSLGHGKQKNKSKNNRSLS